MSQNVLYGIFPVVAGGAAASAAWLVWKRRPLEKFRHMPLGAKLAKLHRFSDPGEGGRIGALLVGWPDDGGDGTGWR